VRLKPVGQVVDMQLGESDRQHMIERKGPLPLGPDSQIFHLNGIPSRFREGAAGDCFWQEPQGSWQAVQGNGPLYVVEEQCVTLHQDFAAAIFGDIGRFYALLRIIPPFLDQAGYSNASGTATDFTAVRTRSTLG
jgi:hypothetical protein